MRAAFKTSLPIMVTFVVLGIGYGLLMEKSGYGPLWSLASGLIIFSGTVQFVSVTMLGSGSVLMAAVTALLVAARHIFFSISMIGRYRSEGRKKWYLYYALCDETYAMLSRDEMPAGVNISSYRLLAGKPLYEGHDERHAFRLVLVGVDASVPDFCCDYLAEIVRKSEQHKAERVGYPVSERCRSVYHLHGMGPHITFRVKYGILLQAYRLPELREPGIELIHLPERFEKHGRPVCLEKCLFQLAFNAFR